MTASNQFPNVQHRVRRTSVLTMVSAYTYFPMAEETHQITKGTIA